MNDDLYAKFQGFLKLKNSGLDFYFVDAVELLRLWWNAYGSKGTIKAIAMFEKHYLQMSSLNLDDFCRWVYHVRKSSIQGKEADILELPFILTMNYHLTQLQCQETAWYKINSMLRFLHRVLQDFICQINHNQKEQKGMKTISHG